MCSLLDDQLVSGRKPYPLDNQSKRLVEKLFLAGGVSFNHSKDSKSESRRVELRVVFFGLKDKPSQEENIEEHDLVTNQRRDFCRIYRK